MHIDEADRVEGMWVDVRSRLRLVVAETYCCMCLTSPILDGAELHCCLGDDQG